MIKVAEILKELENTSSSNKKKEILEREKDNELFKKVLYYTYNYYINYGVNKVREYTPSRTACSLKVQFAEMFLILDLLKVRTLTGNAALDTIDILLHSLDKDTGEIFIKILNKNLDIGLTESTINKVYPNFIPTYKCMLADVFSEKTINKETDYLIVEPKLDGYRALVHIDHSGTVELRTRNGNVIKGFTEIEEACKKYLEKGYVYDSEIESNESFNGTQSSVFNHDKDKKGRLTLFDVIPFDEFMEQRAGLPLFTTANESDRNGELFGIETTLAKYEVDVIRIIPREIINVYKVDSSTGALRRRTYPELLDQLNDILDGYEVEGYEGSMVKRAESPYMYKRDRAWSKMKKFHTYDCLVIDVEEGKGKLKGSLGALVVSYNGNTVNVGSGFSEALRKELWNIKESVIGTMVEIKAQEETTNKKGTSSLRFPVFIKFREDKA